MKLKATRLALTLFAALVAVVLLPSPAAYAQITAQIHGTVTDPTGAVIPGATIVALNTGTGISTTQTTNGHGFYVVPALAVGHYTVTISKKGFQTYKQVGLILRVSDQREINATLKPSAVATTVQVSANELQVETSNTELRDTITAKQIAALPSLGRDPEYYQKLMPGTVESSDRFGNYSSNGSQTQMNSYLLDGADINDAPLQSEGLAINPDALSEVEIVSSTLSPQYSRNSGAVVNATIKNGTNQFHGNGFEYYRDTFLNNGNYFSPIRPRFHQNEYGGTLGGPVIKKKLFFFLAYQGFRNSTAVTTLTPVPTNAQLGRNGSGIAALSGDYNVLNGGNNNSVGLSTNPLPFALKGPNGTTCAAGTPWDQCFPGGVVNIPTSDFNPIAGKLLTDYVPSPNYNGSYYNFNAPNAAAEDQGIIRLDYQASQKDLLWADTVFQSSPDTTALPFDGADLMGFPEKDAQHFKIFTADWTHTFNANTLNDLRASYFRFNFAAVEPQQVVQPSSLGFSINPQDPSVASVPTISVAGYFTLGFSPFGPQPRVDTNELFTDTLTRIQGNNSLKFGASVERFAVHNPFYSENNGDFGFSGSGSFTSGDPLLDFLVGIPSSYLQGSGAEIDARAWEIYAFAQDSWKASNSLTINYGTGYDIETPFANLQYGGEAMICFAPGAQSKIFPTAQASLLYPGDPGCNDMGGATTKYDHLAPRFGFDWSPSRQYGFLTGPAGDHQFAVRGGFGVYFNRDSEEAQLQNLEDPPFGTSSTGAGDVGGSPSFANPYQDVAGRAAYSEANKFPYTFPKPGAKINFSQYVPYDLSTINKNYSVPYTMNFNLQIQRQIPGDQVLSVGYVGSLGRHLVRAYEADRITPAGHTAAVTACKAMGTSACLGNAAFLSLNDPQYYTETSGNFLSVGQVYTDGASNYNSLQVELRKAESHGIFYQLSYTWSHALDNASGFESSGFGNSNDLTGTNWVPGFQYLSYGNSDYNAFNRFVAAYGYQIPLWGRLKNNWIANETIGGWNIVGITTLQSGFPVSIGETGTNRSLYCNGIFSFYSCPDTPETSTYNIKIRNPRTLYGGQHYWFNPAPFSPEPIGTFGNVKRNFFAGPGYNYTDLSIYKNFPLGRPGTPRYIQITLQAFNAFNHPNFARPDGNLSDGAQFGTITSVKQPVLAGGDPQPGRAVQLVGKIYF
jgi:hypothetical protein